MKILGLRIGHDASACLVVDGQVVADVEEERFSRVKKDASFPVQAVEYCLAAAGIEASELDAVAVGTQEFQEALHTFFEFPAAYEFMRFSLANMPGGRLPGIAPAALRQPQLSRERRVPRRDDQIATRLPLYRPRLRLSSRCRLCLVNHHLAHAASAFFSAPFPTEAALCVVMDGCGDGISNSVWRLTNDGPCCLAAFDGGTSLGWFYACATEAMGWRQSMDEWKVMGLAPFSPPSPGLLNGLHPTFERGWPLHSVDFGRFSRWHDHGANHYHNALAARMREIMQRVGRESFAAEVQRVVETSAADFVLAWVERTGCRDLLCAGGCFLNVKLNRRIWYSGALDRHWVYPNAGDAGLPVGAALFVHRHLAPGVPLRPPAGFYAGPEFSEATIREILDARQLDYVYSGDIVPPVVELLQHDRVVGWFQGRMEAGPRALGNRSILASPLRESNRDLVNRKIKFRETFRPFCPSVLHERADDYFRDWRDAFYMVIAFDVLEQARGRIPAVVHVDGTARPQLVRREVNPRYYHLIEEFGKRTGEYALLNTSFNIKGEPIVCTPREAIKCFFDTGMDALAMGNFLLRKRR